jgi:hypothetical protein
MHDVRSCYTFSALAPYFVVTWCAEGRWGKTLLQPERWRCSLQRSHILIHGPGASSHITEVLYASVNDAYTCVVQKTSKLNCACSISGEREQLTLLPLPHGLIANAKYESKVHELHFRNLDRQAH